MLASLHGYWVKQIHSTTFYPMIKMGPLLILIVLTGTASTMRVFSFNSSEGNVQLSSAVLSNSPSSALPEKFIVCFAMKQEKIERSSPFLIKGTETVIPGLLPVFGTWAAFSYGLTWTRANGSSSKRLKNLGSFGSMCAHTSTSSPGISRCLWTAARPWLEDQRNWGERTNQTSWRITLSSGSLTRKL